MEAVADPPIEERRHEQRRATDRAQVVPRHAGADNLQGMGKMLLRVVVVGLLLLTIGVAFPTPLVATILSAVATALAGWWTIHGLRHARLMSRNQ